MIDISHMQTDDAVKLSTAMIVSGYAADVEASIDAMPLADVREYAKRAIRYLAEVKSADMPQEAP